MKKKIIISSLIAMFICIAPGLTTKAGTWTATGEENTINKIDDNSWILQSQSNVYESQRTEQESSSQAQKIAKEYEGKGKSEKTIVTPDPYNLIDSFQEGINTIDRSNKIYSRTTQVKYTDLITQEGFKQWAEAQSGSAAAEAYSPSRHLQYTEYNQTINVNGETIHGATIYHYIRYPRIVYTETATQKNGVIMDTRLKYYVWRYYCENDASQNATVTSFEKYRKFTPEVHGKWTVTATPFYYQVRSDYQEWSANATIQYVKKGSGQVSAPPKTVYSASGKRNYKSYEVDIGENENEKRTWNFDFAESELGIEKTPSPPNPVISITDGYTYETGLTQ